MRIPASDTPPASRVPYPWPQNGKDRPPAPPVGIEGAADLRRVIIRRRVGPGVAADIVIEAVLQRGFAKSRPPGDPILIQIAQRQVIVDRACPHQAVQRGRTAR